jgi:photosystem II stability/assembly factor-like uncharacterized protein
MASSSPLVAAPERAPAHWVDKSVGLPEEPLTAVAVDPFDDLVVYAGLDGFLFRSDDGGDTWAVVLSFPRGLVDDGLSESVAAALDNADGQNATAQQGAGLDDGDDDDDGALDPDVDPDAADADELNADDTATEDEDEELPEGNRQAAAGDDDAPDSADLSIPNRVYPGVRSLAFVPGQKGSFYVATPRGLFRTLDGAKTFVALAVPGGSAENDVRDVVVDPSVVGHLFVATAAGMWFSRDGGATLEPPTGVGRTVPTVCLAIDRVGEETWVVLGTEAGLLRSRDGGGVFTELLLHGHTVAPVIHAVAWARDGGILYAGTGRGLFAAERNAPILERYDGVPPDPPTAISIDPSETGGIAVALARRSNSVVFSDDTGLTLVEVDRLPAPAANALARETKDANRLWAATDRGLFHLEKGTGISLSRDGAADLRDRFAREPPLEMVVQSALRRRGLGGHDDRYARVRWAAILPRLQVRFDGVSTQGEISRDTFIFNDGTEIDDGTLLEDGLAIITPSTTTAWRLTALLSWDLDRLILNPAEGAVFRAQPVVQNAEHGLIDRVRELYVTRRRLIADMRFGTASEASGKKALVDNVRAELKLQEVEATLASLVGADVFDPSAAQDPE